MALSQKELISGQEMQHWSGRSEAVDEVPWEAGAITHHITAKYGKICTFVIAFSSIQQNI